MTQPAFAGLPDALRRRADIAGNGELLWPRAAACEAIAWLAGRGLGVLGFEVYGRLLRARGHFQHEWSVDPGWRDGEAWEEYVARAAAATSRKIEADAGRREPGGTPGEVADRRYFVAASNDADYPESLRCPR